MYVLFAGCFGINGKLKLMHTHGISSCVHLTGALGYRDKKYRHVTIIKPSQGTQTNNTELKSIIFYQTSRLLMNRPEIPPVLSVFQTKKQPSPPQAK